MGASETAATTAASPPRAEPGPPPAPPPPWWRSPSVLAVAALTALGAGLRLAVARQSLFGDELSTYWIIHGRSLGGALSVVSTDAEITPPLSFVASWLSTRPELSPELLRLPALISGVATIPLVFALGVRTVGRRAAVVAAALTTLSPFMIYYSAEARAYGLMVALVLLSTLTMLRAVDGGGRPWWVAYAVCSSAAMYTHYTSAFALAAQLLWLLWAHPRAWRPALLANAVAAVGYLPWLSGLRSDLRSPTTDIISLLQPLTANFVRISFQHWTIGFPYTFTGTGLADLPGVPALLALGLALGLASVRLVARALRSQRRRVRLDAGVVLVVVLALAAPLGELAVDLVSSNLFGTRNLAVSWPAFALCLATFLVAAGPRLGTAAAVLAVGAFGVGAVKMLQAGFARPDAEGVAALVDRDAGRRDVVVDSTVSSPAGVPGAIQTSLKRRHRLVEVGRPRVRYGPYRELAPPIALPDALHRAVAAARGGRVFLVVFGSGPTRATTATLGPEGYGPVRIRRFPGTMELTTVTFAPRPGLRG